MGGRVAVNLRERRKANNVARSACGGSGVSRAALSQIETPEEQLRRWV